MMERLTEKQSSGYDLKAMNGEYCNRYCEQQRVETCNECVIYQAIQKLAEYEDFEEIFREKMTDTACEFLKDREEFNKWIDRNKWIAKKCDEYARAEEQGLLLRLPCKVGDTVYIILASYFDIGTYNIKYAKADVRDFAHFTSCGFCVVATSKVFGRLTIPFSDFGKTVFLTKTEAEQKLKEMDGD